MLFTIVSIFQNLIFLIIAAILGYFGWQKWQENQPKRGHRDKKKQLSAIGTYNDNEENLSHEEEILAEKMAAKHNLELFGVPDLEAGSNLVHVPCINPQKEGWDDNRIVISTSRIFGYSRSGKITSELIELNSGYILLATGNKVSILKKYNLTQTEEKELENQRKDAVTKGDGIIESFLGQEWAIKKAYGDNNNQRPGEKKCSYMQVLTLHPDLGNGTYRSILPPELCDYKEHDYYDMRAIGGDDGKLLYFFYAAGSWTCYIGRFLLDEEISQMTGI